jgi:DNA (cytosine-5)-methyltransferase 1
MDKKKPVTLGSLFDGIGGFPYASQFYGITPLWASEILPQAVSVTKRHFPMMEHVGDITCLDGGRLPPGDIIAFGSPCQDLSVAGKRKGLKGARSGLFTEAIRIIDEMRRSTDGRYPRYALWENVPGAFSSGGGLDFKAVLEAFTKSEVPVPKSGRWANAGMVRSGCASLAWRVLNACLWGVPQRRRRIFLVADLGGESAGEILFVEEGLRRYFAQGEKTRQEAPAHAGGCAPYAVPRGIKGVAATMYSGHGVKWNGNAGAYDGSNFALPPSPGHLMAFACNQRDEARLLGNRAGALAARPGTKQQTFVAQKPDCLNPWDTQQARVFTEDGSLPTLAGADGGGGRNPAGLIFCPESDQLHTEAGNGHAGTPSCKDKQPSGCEPDIARALTARGDGSPCADREPNMVVFGTMPKDGEPAEPYDFDSGVPCADAVKTPSLTMRIRDGCGGGGKGPLLQEEKNGALATGNDQYLFKPAAVGVHQNGDGDISTSGLAYSLATSGNASARSAPLVAHGCIPAVTGVTSKGNGDCFLSPECHCALSGGGGQAGQGYPAVMESCLAAAETRNKTGNTSVHPDISGTICVSGAGLSRPAGMASEPDLCVAYALQGNMIGRQEQNGPGGSGISENLSFALTKADIPAAVSAIPINDKATRYKGGGPTRNDDGAGNGLGIGKLGDPSPTVTAGDHHAVATVFNRQRSDRFKEQDIACTQSARQYRDATDLICQKGVAAGVSAVDCRNYKEIGDISGTLQAKDRPGYSLNYQNPVRTGYIVRRLTPTECERLQGFPDGWTQIGHDGKEISDTRRYQMLGNSVAIPCVSFVISGIVAQIYHDGKREEVDQWPM